MHTSLWLLTFASLHEEGRETGQQRQQNFSFLEPDIRGRATESSAEGCLGGGEAGAPESGLMEAIQAGK